MLSVQYPEINPFLVTPGTHMGSHSTGTKMPQRFLYSLAWSRGSRARRRETKCAQTKVAGFSCVGDRLDLDKIWRSVLSTPRTRLGPRSAGTEMPQRFLYSSAWVAGCARSGAISGARETKISQHLLPGLSSSRRDLAIRRGARSRGVGSEKYAKSGRRAR